MRPRRLPGGSSPGSIESAFIRNGARSRPESQRPDAFSAPGCCVGSFRRDQHDAVRRCGPADSVRRRQRPVVFPVSAGSSSNGMSVLSAVPPSFVTYRISCCSACAALRCGKPPSATRVDQAAHRLPKKSKGSARRPPLRRTALNGHPHPADGLRISRLLRIFFGIGCSARNSAA